MRISTHFSVISFASSSEYSHTLTKKALGAAISKGW